MPGENDSPARFHHDPDNPVPTIAANVTGFYEQVVLGEGDGTPVHAAQSADA